MAARRGGGRLGDPLFGAPCGGLHPCGPGTRRILLPPCGLERRRADRRTQGRGRHGAGPGAGGRWRTALQQTERRPVGGWRAPMTARTRTGRSGSTDAPGHRRPGGRRIVDMGRAWMKNMGETFRSSFLQKRSRRPPTACCRTREYRWSMFWNRISRRLPSAAARHPSFLPFRTRRR